MSEITVRVRASSTYGIDFPGSHKMADGYVSLFATKEIVAKRGLAEP
jgi:hypothetical protein